MSIPGRSHLCWTPESLVGRLACVARQVSPGRGCLLTNSSLTHSLPVFLDLVLSVQGFFSQIVVGRPCLFLTCHWLLADFFLFKTSLCQIVGKSDVVSASCHCWGPSPLCLINFKVVDFLIRFLAPQVGFGHLSSPYLAVRVQLNVI